LTLFLWVPVRACLPTGRDVGNGISPHGPTGVASGGQKNEEEKLEIARAEAARKW